MTGDDEGETVEATRSGSADIAAIDVVVRAVTGAFKAVTGVMVGHGAAEMHTFLVECQPVGAIVVTVEQLAIELVGELGAAETKFAGGGKVNNIAAGNRSMEDAAPFEHTFVGCGSRKFVAFAHGKHATEIIGDRGIEVGKGVVAGGEVEHETACGDDARTCAEQRTA